MMKRFVAAALPLALILFVGALAQGAHPEIDTDKGWECLFCGKDLSKWTCRDTKGRPTGKPNWVVEDGVIVRKGGGYLWSNEKYGDFILDLEFNVAPGTNSGVIFRHNADPNAKSYWWNGLLEMQVLDSARKQNPGKHDCGSLYDMIAPKANAMKPAGQWNRVTITAKGTKINIVMNCQEIVDIDLADWDTAQKNPDGSPNKYHEPMCELTEPGHILLQEHGGDLKFRNIYIKPLD